jgi:hypothetical protein
MSVAIEPIECELHDENELPIRLAQHWLTTSSGKPSGEQQLPQAEWGVLLTTDGQKIRRDLWLDCKPWSLQAEGWQPEGVIWPTWPAKPADEVSSSESALKGVEKYWNQTGNRLRDSAKWMAAVLGAALATIVGTSPLASIRHNHYRMAAVILGIAGLVLLCVTLFLIVQVMRPQATTFADVQQADNQRGSNRTDKRSRRFKSALGRWRETVESHQDLYMPCGVKCLTGLRQCMIIEKITLIALAKAKECASCQEMLQLIEQAVVARAVRLAELRSAAAQIAAIGDYYRLRARSTRATYGGILCFVAGSAAIIAAFLWPPA